MRIKVDVSLITFDNLLTLVGQFTELSSVFEEDQGFSPELFKAYKPIFAYFLVDENGEPIQDKQKAEEIVGNMPAVEVVPYFRAVMDAVGKLAEALTVPPENGGN
jgi:hypothetical protein